MALTRLEDDYPTLKEFINDNLYGLLPIKEFTIIQDVLASDPILASNPILSAEDALFFIDVLTNGIINSDGVHYNIEAIGLFVCNFNGKYEVFFDAKSDGTYFKDTGGGSPDPNPFPVH